MVLPDVSPNGLVRFPSGHCTGRTTSTLITRCRWSTGAVLVRFVHVLGDRLR